jgi:hypothetical protein
MPVRQDLSRQQRAPHPILNSTKLDVGHNDLSSDHNTLTTSTDGNSKFPDARHASHVM